MPPNIADGDIPISSGVRKYPSFRDEKVKSPHTWMKGKRQDDGAEGLWRIHNSLYDFTDFINRHPGGADWLQITKGTDITEAFEAHHISPGPENMLKKFYIRDAVTPRNSPFTFHENGFYRTLKRKVRAILKETGPTYRSYLLQDGLVSAFFITMGIAAYTKSYMIGAISGVFLAMSTICAHNFFHQRDNWRMYCFDLSFMSSLDWRISHALSHHLFTNTILDLEISVIEPFFQYLPKRSKTTFQRFLPWLYSPLVWAIGFHMELIRKIVHTIKGEIEFQKASLLPLVNLLYIWYITGNFLYSFWFWNWIHVASSFYFFMIGFNAAHHHPNIYHDGDAARTDADWGLRQLDAVRDRIEIEGSLFLVLTNFGSHSLHHMFPTVDHSRLAKIQPILQETCKEFGYDYKYTTIWNLVCGQFRQLANNSPNPIPPDASNKNK